MADLSMLLGAGGVVPSGGGGYDTDAQTYFTAAGITDTPTKDAWNTCVLALKSASIWTKFIGLWPILGGTNTSVSVNAKNPGTFDLGLVASPTVSALEISWNGTTQYATTGIVPSTHLSKDDKSMGYYSRANTNPAAAAGEMGCQDSTGGTTYDGMFIRSGTDLFAGYLSDLNNIAETNTSSIGFFVISRLNGTQINMYRDGVAVGTNPKSSSSTAGQPTSAIDLGRANGQYTNRACALAYQGYGLTSAEVTSMQSAFQTLWTAVGK